jgi:HSP20 family protein
MDRIQREMNRLFDESNSSTSFGIQSYPRLNIWADENSAIVTAEIPGISPEDLELNLTGDTLTIRGQRRMPELQEGAKYHRQERSYGQFSRNLQLPFTFDADKVEAKFRNGVLEIMLPRTEQDKPRKIAVSQT